MSARMSEDDYWEQYDDRLDDAKPTSGEVEESICPACNGSGEGSYDGSRCRECGGTGVLWLEVVESDLEGQDEGELEPKGI